MTAEMWFKTGEVIAAQPTWWLYDTDNALVAWAGMTYRDAGQAVAAADTFRRVATSARFELVVDRQRRWRWLALVDGLKVAASTEGYPDEVAARRAARQVRDRVARSTPVQGGPPPALRRTAD